MTMELSAEMFETMRRNTQRVLLDAREAEGYWIGQLSSSPLSTATAVIALSVYQQKTETSSASHADLIQNLISRGRDWLKEHQNADGGWGDTVKSLSNISTTLLCWGAIHRAPGDFQESDRRATEWIRACAGGVTPEVIAPAIRKRYGKDQTFSVPILAALAITGRLGDAAEAWRYVPQLPFELAAFPRRMFAALRMPVVSYALPALIAIGLVKHRNRPSRNPLIRAIRNSAARRTLEVLRSIQPSTGGFLEATPLTSFVAMSLVFAGEQGNAVVREGIRFLFDSVRPDGSWPIDTHLATWVSTLAINGLFHSSEFPAISTPQELERLRKWLIDQQYSTRHPYTDAAPGGWAWTPLSGGVPDADDTPSALLALDGFQKALPQTESDNVQRAESGIRWLIGLQNADGGIPTFCRGWGTLPFDRSNPDITAHGIRAMICWQKRLPSVLRTQIDVSLRRASVFLAKKQEASGAWSPLWFGNQFAADESNRTYGTSRVLLALLSLLGHPAEMPRERLHAGLNWLLQSQNSDGGWGGDAGVVSTIEETALALETLAACIHQQRQESLWSDSEFSQIRIAIRVGLTWLFTATDAGTSFAASPIGFYFAKLWYFEKLYPIVFSVAALNRTRLISRELFS